MNLTSNLRLPFLKDAFPFKPVYNCLWVSYYHAEVRFSHILLIQWAIIIIFTNNVAFQSLFSLNTTDSNFCLHDVIGNDDLSTV